MSDKKPFIRGIYYFDVVAVLLIAVIILGHFFIRDTPVSPAVARDLGGAWLPLLAVTLLIAFRRRAYTQATPWVVQAFAALTFIAVGAIFWRWNIFAFVAAMLGVSGLLLAGLVLRTKRIAESLSRTDVAGLAGVVLSVTLTLGLAEGFLRFAPGLFGDEIEPLLRGADPRTRGVTHPYIGHLHTPNIALVMSGRDFHAVHNVDGLGFRNRWPWPERADIVTVGDSVTFGQNVQDEEAWPDIVGQNLSPRPLVNLGLIGAGPQQYLRVFETFGVPLRPRLVLVGLFPRNDFWDADTFDGWVKSGTGGNYMVWRDFGRPGRPTLSLRHPRYSLETLTRHRVLPALRRSYLFALVHALRGTDDQPLAPPRIFRFEDGRSLQLLEDDFLSKTVDARPGRRVFRLVVESLQQIHTVAGQHGAQALTVLLPGKEEVYLPLLGVTIPDPTLPLRSELDRLGIEYLDLGPTFRAHAAAGEQLFFEVDGHPNRAGQALIARLVHEHIVQHAERYGLAD